MTADFRPVPLLLLEPQLDKKPATAFAKILCRRRHLIKDLAMVVIPHAD
jgi:hypothetical protein